MRKVRNSAPTFWALSDENGMEGLGIYFFEFQGNLRTDLMNGLAAPNDTNNKTRLWD